MKEEIEMLRKELNMLTEEAECLHSDKVVELSQRLDKLIYSYYKSTISI
ncbi:aspartyl-phosphate phosphatase Spo0E family protein [Clostridium sp. JN-9]|mgnify:CR=1 FL=1|nr:aspartyl-phosphate phosphatase Spo0E family protein [Clostridium sp. JN-9]QAT39775.1 aspartyl-phosphate phosphatase Spo0E family protein [Clostridium sp. JN-9]